VPKRDSRVFDHCNVCGRKLHTEEEDRVGMCEVCGNL
jgi:DNA-directed RNA polymerase subunit RPC12/RpoP